MLHSRLLHRRKVRRQTVKRTRQYRDYIRREAAIGGTLFGPVPKNVRREFVCVNKNTWLWHEEWVDEQNVWHMSTTRYDVRPTGIFKMQGDGSVTPVSPQEAQHLRNAAILYNEQVQVVLYRQLRG